MAKPRGQDAFGRRARREGYPARSVYKLEEIDRRTGLLRRGHRVVDLGAAPGSWTLFISGKVGPAGRVIAVDRRPFEIPIPENATFVEADVLAAVPDALKTAAPFDVVLSDMAPSTSGQRHRDQYRSYELFLRALEVARDVLKPGGAFAAKIFQGAEFAEARRETGARFEKVRIMKPRASRGESYETYLVGIGFRSTDACTKPAG
jgi:23S rRNA (uridine2552-2'-O)-methyltransferase